MLLDPRAARRWPGRNLIGRLDFFPPLFDQAKSGERKQKNEKARGLLRVSGFQTSSSLPKYEKNSGVFNTLPLEQKSVCWEAFVVIESLQNPLLFF